jgi:hypothetical protein
MLLFLLHFDCRRTDRKLTLVPSSSVSLLNGLDLRRPAMALEGQRSNLKAVCDQRVGSLFAASVDAL